MKKFSIIVALMIAIFISGKASAANWEVIENENGIVISIDKDSMRHGTDSKKFPKFNRTDGFSAIVQIDVDLKELGENKMVYLASFYEKDGARMFCLLDGYEGVNFPAKESDVVPENIDTDAKGWIKVWEYIEANLK